MPEHDEATHRRRELWPSDWDDRIHALFVGAFPIAGVLVYAFVRLADEGKLRLAHGSVSGEVRALLWFALLSGLTSFAIIEGLNRVAQTRGRFQRWQTRRWFQERTRKTSLGWVAFDELLAAWHIGYTESLRIFDLPPEQLAAQISSAVEATLSRGGADSALLQCFVGRDDATEEQVEFQRAQRVRLGIDQLQIALADRWRRTVQGAAIWVAGLVGIALAHAIDQPLSTEPSYVLAALLIGGPLAWLVHDFAALIQHARH